MSSEKDFKNDVENQWCPGCPNFSILQAYKKAFAELGKSPHEICIVSGIGQAAKLPHYLNCNFFNGLHGRALPVATGIRAVNPDLTILVASGDGDCYGEGGNHFIHALRRNPDITVVVHNNEIYALTKGQASPTTRRGETRALQQSGVELEPLNMQAVAIAHGCGFVARGFTGDIDHLTGLIVEAVKHPGFSFLEVIQPCISWKTHPVSWYKERVYKLGEDYDPEDRAAALEKVLEKEEKIPLGVLYRRDPGRRFDQRYREQVDDGVLASLEPVSTDTIETLLAEFKAEY